MKLIFCGTPQFAVPTLERLFAEGLEIELVVTNPDEPSGRSYKPKPPPVKQAALQSGLPLFQPARLKDPDVQSIISRYAPDAIIVVAYGHIIPKWMIDMPRFGCINLHASLLPKYRGAAPVPWAIVRGERVTGVTTMLIDEGLDTGNILLQREAVINDDDTAGTLLERLGGIGPRLMVETLRDLESGAIVPRTQDHREATLAPMLKKQDGQVDWRLTAGEIARRVRGFDPWPGAFTSFLGKILRIWKATPAAFAAGDEQPGTLWLEHHRLYAACGGASWLELRELQLESRKRMAARDFIQGAKPRSGERLGSGGEG
jgi:methionyl-tRNA formyltransferase